MEKLNTNSVDDFNADSIDNSRVSDINILIGELEKNYYSYDILQLIDIIQESLTNKIFFEADPSLAFPPNDVASVKINDKHRAAIRLSMMGLFGITSPLPIRLSDYITRGSLGSETLRDFFSIMQNRVHTLWVDALRKYSVWKDAGKPAELIFEMITARQLNQFKYHNLFWMGAFSRKTRSADGLKLIIRSIWRDIPVNIDENIGRWTTVENIRPLGSGLRLGKSSPIGSKVYDRTAKFRISLGPLDISTYKSFLPDQHNTQLLSNIIFLYLNEPMICELEISCNMRDFEPVRLGGTGGLGRTAVLGRIGDDDRVHRYRAVVPTGF